MVFDQLIPAQLFTSFYIKKVARGKHYNGDNLRPIRLISGKNKQTISEQPTVEYAV